MQTFIEVILGWIVLSCTVGPVLTWAFFYSKREAKAARNQRITAHPTASSKLMPRFGRDFAKLV
jgi:hypothetical protein